MGDITKNGQGLPFRYDPRRHSSAPAGNILLTPQNEVQAAASSNEPALDALVSRHQAQLNELDRVNPRSGDGPLIIPLRERYMKVSVSWPEGSDANAVKSINDEPVLPSDFLYLFNVIVALEWQPSNRTLGQIASAFVQTSDLLYDATDGQMAFGQVLIGDQQYMRCADVQILASNRYYPRSWIDGMMEAAKYTPIRIGRGWWEKGLGIAIPWSNSIGPRVLVHEWCHYALGLKDEYLTKRPIRVTTDRSGLRLMEDPNGTRLMTFIRPNVSSESLMDNLEGATEIIPQGAGSRSARRQQNQNLIRRIGGDGAARFGQVDLTTTVLEGPDHLPLDLPEMYSLFDNPPVPLKESQVGNHAQEHLWRPSHTWTPHTWLYLFRKQHDGWALIPQGSIDNQTSSDGFWLLGARNNDQLIIIGKKHIHNQNESPQNVTGISQLLEHDGPPSVWSFPLTIDAAGKVSVDETYDERPLPKELPVITVIPEVPGDNEFAENAPNTAPIVQVSVRVTGLPPHLLATPDQVKLTVFPLGNATTIKDSWPHSATMSLDENALVYGPFTVPSLDGQVMIEWDNSLLIADYSQGGGPSTSVRAPEPPISAGSSDGNAMIYFTEPDYETNRSYRLEHSRIRIVTTRNYGGFDESLPGSPRSYLYSLASSKRIPVDAGSTAPDTQPHERVALHPTLVMNFNRPLNGQGELFIYSYLEADQKWQPLVTYIADGAPRAAYPLDRSSNTGFALEPADAKAYHFRLFLVDSAEPATQT